MGKSSSFNNPNGKIEYLNIIGIHKIKDTRSNSFCLIGSENWIVDSNVAGMSSIPF